MFTAKQYRAKAAEYTELLKTTSLPAEIREFRKLEQSYLTLAENEEWMADNREKINSPGADENWYGDAIIAQQGKDTLGCHGADVARQSTSDPPSSCPAPRRKRARSYLRQFLRGDQRPPANASSSIMRPDPLSNAIYLLTKAGSDLWQKPWTSK